MHWNSHHDWLSLSLYFSYREINENITFTYCLPYPNVFVIKSLTDDLGEVLSQVVKIINNIKSSSLELILFEKIENK